MGRNIGRPGADDILAPFSGVTEFYSEALDRHYSIAKRGDRYYHRETQKDANNKVVYTAERELTYSVGAGLNGWSYLISDGDRFYMSPITYYTRQKRWDLSPGYQSGTFTSFSRPVSAECLVCHSGRPSPVPGTVNVYKDPPFEALAIGCERCHGPGSEHVELASEGETDPAKLAIVNAAKLSGPIRDNICDQCHLRGDARVFQPGKTLLDFRAGQPLDDIVSIFSVPLEYEGKEFPGISHAERLRSSRCWVGSRGSLGCVTCHNPHNEPKQDQKVAHYRKSCLKCHQVDSCAAKPEFRQSTQPADNCIFCHMPRLPFEEIPHSTGTEHRISRFPSRSPSTPDKLNDLSGGELRHLTGTKVSSRTLALAYAQVARSRAQFRVKGYALLERAILEYPDDLELNETFGLIQLRVSTSLDSVEKAAALLQKAVDLGSASGNVHHTLARIRLRQGRVEDAIGLLKKGIEFEPHYSPCSTLLAEIVLRLGDAEGARAIVEKALAYNPGDPALRMTIDQIH